MTLQQGLIFLGLGVFTLILLDALRRKLASRRQEKAAIRAEQEDATGSMNELSNYQADPLFDEPESFADGFEQDPIPILSEQQLVKPPLPEVNFNHPVSTPAAFQVAHPEYHSDDEYLAQSQQDSTGDYYPHDNSYADDYPQANSMPPSPAARQVAAKKPTGQNNPDTKATPENAWENMRRRFELDPSFAKASKVSMQEQQRELELLQEVKTQQALRYGVVKQQHFDTRHNDLADLDLPSGLANSTKSSAKATSAATTQSKPPKKSMIGRRVTNKSGVKVTLPSKPLKDRVVELTPAPKEERDRKNEQKLRQKFLASLERNTWGNASEFITLNLHANPEKPFYYVHLQEFARATEMKFSEAGFYHFTEEEGSESYLGYSMINMYNPGNFLNPDDDPYLSTQGLVLLTTLPSTPDPLKTFDRLLTVAQVIARNWEAELQDEHHSNLTQQTIEHYRQKIRDFEYKARIKAIKESRES